jgi:hypothetical protein
MDTNSSHDHVSSSSDYELFTGPIQSLYNMALISVKDVLHPYQVIKNVAYSGVGRV